MPAKQNVQRKSICNSVDAACQASAPSLNNLENSKFEIKLMRLIACLLAAITYLLVSGLPTSGQDDKSTSASKAPSPAAGDAKSDQKAGAGEAKTPGRSSQSAQSAVASKTAKFEKVAKTDESVKSAM